MIPVLATILGIGFLLLIHEAGHYLAARAAGIRVEVFALGFGPRLLGWRRGETDFRIALLPLGGYVRVSGEDPTRPPRPGDLFAASVRQRLLFYAGGILMNFLFAFLLLPILFLVGVPFEAPVVGSVTPGGAAWMAGIQSGDRILEVDGREIHGFRDISTAVALGTAGEPLPITVQHGDGEVRHLQVVPDFDQARGFPEIGVAPSYGLVVLPGSELAAALPPASELIAVDDIPISDEFSLRLIINRAIEEGRPLRLRYRQANGEEGEWLHQPRAMDPSQLPAQLGVLQINRRVAAVRGPLAKHLEVGDLILAVGHTPVHQRRDLLLAIGPDGLPSLTVQKADGQTLVLPSLPELSREELGASLSLDAEAHAPYAIRPGGAAAAAGLQDGDHILRVDNQAIADLDALREAVARHARDHADEAMSLLVARAGHEEPLAFSLDLAPVPSYELDLAYQLQQETVRSSNPLRAIAMGLREARSMVTEVLRTMQRMVTGEIDRRNLGGIISIGQITHTMAAAGLIPLLFFLCLISVNLGVLNLLPVPALDGGHILFALIEMVRRKPVSLRVQAAFQVVGVFLVLALILFVTTMDIQRLMS